LGTIDALVRAASGEVRSHPGNAACYTKLAVAFMRKQRESGDPAYYGRAEQALRKALALSPDNYEALKTLAWVQMGQHRFAEARKLAEQCIRLQPNDYWNYGTLGDADVELGEYPAAVEAVQHMVDLKPGLPAYARVAYLRELHGKRPGAIKMMVMAAEAANPVDHESNAWCWTQVGDLAFKGGELKEARHSYDVALHWLPDYYLALAGQARVATAERKLDEAERCLTRAIAVIPRPDLLAAVGDVYALAGKSEQARKQYDLVVQVEAVNRAAGAPDNRHLSLFYANHDRDLATALSLARREFAARHDIYTCDALAWALYKNRRYAEAWSMARQAMRLKTEDAAILYHAGMIAERVPGGATDARRLLQRALAVNPYFDPRQAPQARRVLAALGAGRRELAVVVRRG
jgi:tetratricopeptide (TPR) repeat protein